MLTLEEPLIETDPDLTLAATMVIGFDDNVNLALEYRVTDCNIPLETRIKYVSVDKENAYVLAKKVNTTLTKFQVIFAEDLGNGLYAKQPLLKLVLCSEKYWISTIIMA